MLRSSWNGKKFKFNPLFYFSLFKILRCHFSLSISNSKILLGQNNLLKFQCTLCSRFCALIWQSALLAYSCDFCVCAHAHQFSRVKNHILRIPSAYPFFFDYDVAIDCDIITENGHGWRFQKKTKESKVERNARKFRCGPRSLPQSKDHLASFSLFSLPLPRKFSLAFLGEGKIYLRIAASVFVYSWRCERN
jgi:hypothetical protein